MSGKRFLQLIGMALVLLALASCGPNPLTYATDMQGLLTRYAVTSEGVAYEVNRVLEEPTLFGDSGWKADLFSALGEWEVSGKALVDYPAENIPESFAEAHGLIRQIGEKTASTSASIRLAVNEQNVQAFNAAVRQVQEISSLLQRVMQVLKN